MYGEPVKQVRYPLTHEAERGTLHTALVKASYYRIVLAGIRIS
jgi:hypothetical protein